MKHKENLNLVFTSIVIAVLIVVCFWIVLWGVSTLIDIYTVDDTDTESYTVEYDEISSTENTIEVPLNVEPLKYHLEIEPTEGIPEPHIDIIDPDTIEYPSESTDEPEAIETIPKINEEDLELLAIVIYQEAGWDLSCDDCRRRVADIVLNRVESEYFPDTIYEVLTQKGQYGRLHWTGVVWPEMAKYDCEAEAVERAYRIAREVLEGNHSDLYGNGYIWQAEFVQGVDGFWCCGTYFGRN